jgi:hypothetical protein
MGTKGRKREIKDDSAVASSIGRRQTVQGNEKKTCIDHVEAITRCCYRRYSNVTILFRFSKIHETARNMSSRCRLQV